MYSGGKKDSAQWFTFLNLRNCGIYTRSRSQIAFLSEVNVCFTFYNFTCFIYEDERKTCGIVHEPVSKMSETSFAKDGRFGQFSIQKHPSSILTGQPSRQLDSIPKCLANPMSPPLSKQLDLDLLSLILSLSFTLLYVGLDLDLSCRCAVLVFDCSLLIKDRAQPRSRSI